MTSFFVTLMVGLAIALSVAISEYFDDKAREKECKQNRIRIIKEPITDEFDLVAAFLTDEIIKSLEKFAEKMRKIKTDANISSNLKPYDSFYSNKLREFEVDKFNITIDKNLVPKFAPDSRIDLTDKDRRDYQLEACMSLEELEAFIDKCKRKLMDEQIDKHRKKLVEDELK